MVNLVSDTVTNGAVMCVGTASVRPCLENICFFVYNAWYESTHYGNVVLFYREYNRSQNLPQEGQMDLAASARCTRTNGIVRFGWLPVLLSGFGLNNPALNP